MIKKIFRRAGVVFIAGIIIIQFIRPARINPSSDLSVSLEHHFPLPSMVQTSLQGACYDCHSNTTRWPWYSEFAPGSWLVADDVKQGRRHLNFSEWGLYSKNKQYLKLGQIYEEVTKGEMPPGTYTILHPSAKLSAVQRDSIASWIESVQDKLSGGSTEEEKK
jgi:hypothetical protein